MLCGGDVYDEPFDNDDTQWMLWLLCFVYMLPNLDCTGVTKANDVLSADKRMTDFPFLRATSEPVVPPVLV